MVFQVLVNIRPVADVSPVKEFSENSFSGLLADFSCSAFQNRGLQQLLCFLCFSLSGKRKNFLHFLYCSCLNLFLCILYPLRADAKHIFQFLHASCNLLHFRIKLLAVTAVFLADFAQLFPHVVGVVPVFIFLSDFLRNFIRREKFLLG